MAKHAHVVANERLEHQVSWCRAFAEGLRRHGWQVTVSGAPAPSDMLVLWGTRCQAAIGTQKTTGGEVCILERGYLGDRTTWTSVSFGGGLNNRGIFRGPFHDGSRWDRHHAHLLKSWRRRDGYALLIGQVPGDQSIAGVDIAAWYSRTAAELNSAGWDVRLRPHPVAVQRGYSCAVDDVPAVGGDLANALEGAGIVVTFNSNTGVESVLAGASTITMDEGAMAWPVTSHSVGDPIVTPDRIAWAHWLAWCQYTREEISSGFCWDSVRQSPTMPIVPDPAYAA